MPREAKPTRDDFRVYLPTCASHQACDLSDRKGPLLKWTVRAVVQSHLSMFFTCTAHQLRRYLIRRHCLPFLTATDAQAMSL